jgi:hypothetical protein
VNGQYYGESASGGIFKTHQLRKACAKPILLNIEEVDTATVLVLGDKMLADSITKRLDAIIHLLMEAQFREGVLKRKDQILILESVGLSTGEIGRILNIPSKDVSSALKKIKTGD